MLTERMKPSIIVLNISAEMHKQAAICALHMIMALNKIVEQALQSFLMLGNLIHEKNYSCDVAGELYYVRLRI